MSSYSPREVLHVAVGRSACQVSAHWLNLQGLAACNANHTHTQHPPPPLCHPSISHSCKRRSSSRSNDDEDEDESRFWMPRALMIDSRHTSHPYDGLVQQEHIQPPMNTAILETSSSSSSPPSSLVWSHGAVETLKVPSESSLFDGNHNDHSSKDDPSSSSTMIHDDRMHPRPTPQPSQPQSQSQPPQQPQQRRRQVREWEKQSSSTWNDRTTTSRSRSSSSWNRFRAACTTPPSSSRSSFSRISQDEDHHHEEEEEDEEEEEEEEENDYYDAYHDPRQYARKQQQQKQQQQQQDQEALDEFWEHLLLRSEESSTTTSEIPSSSHSSSAFLADWRNYWIPCYSPQSILTLSPPYSSSSCYDDNDGLDWNNNDHHHHLFGGGGGIVEVIEDRLRGLLEECDACQGMVLVDSSLSSLSKGILEYMSDECSGSARRFTVQLLNNNHNKNHKINASSSSLSWRTQHVQTLRSSVWNGMGLADQVRLSAMVLPLYSEPPAPNNNNTYAYAYASFAAQAWIAAALETVTLPYRLHSHHCHSGRTTTTTIPQARLGLNGYYYGHYDPHDEVAAFGTASSMTLSEYVSTLVPSPRHSVLELDTNTSSSSNDRNNIRGNDSDCSSSRMLLQALQQGTRVERDLRMRLCRGSGGGTASALASSSSLPLPGQWLRPLSHGGVVTSLSSSLSSSSSSKKEDDRSRHPHYSLLASLRMPSSSFRTATTTTTTTATSTAHDMTMNMDMNNVDNVLRCLMEGMGLRCRPEQALGCVVTQSVSELVMNHNHGGDGDTEDATEAYWKAILKMRKRRTILQPTTTTTAATQTRSDSATWCAAASTLCCPPLLSVLGNSTRSYASLAGTTRRMRDALTRPHYRGALQRDIAHGCLPEHDECLEALSACYDLRDLYDSHHRPSDDDDDDNHDH